MGQVPRPHHDSGQIAVCVLVERKNVQRKNPGGSQAKSNRYTGKHARRSPLVFSLPVEGPLLIFQSVEQVEPDINKGNSVGREAKTLSGGEKSFSQICFLLALWEAMGSPIRCLDEFDVFMDPVNRKTSIDMLVCFFLICPLIRWLLLFYLGRPVLMQGKLSRWPQRDLRQGSNSFSSRRGRARISKRRQMSKSRSMFVSVLRVIFYLFHMMLSQLLTTMSSLRINQNRLAAPLRGQSTISFARQE